jgi:RHS repeat-associated protein
MTRFPAVVGGPSSVVFPLCATWDSWNRLTRLSTTTGATLATYTYDGDWKRLKKTVATNTTAYYYDDMQLAEVRTNGVASEQFVYDTRYLHSVACRDVLGNGSPSSVVSRLFYCNDGNFNVTALVSTNGAVVERYTYDPYGKVTIRDGEWQPITWDASQKNVCLYTGHKLDAESGLYYSIYRYYHPELGRWLTRDPLLETRENLALRGVSGKDILERHKEGYGYRFYGPRLERWLNRDPIDDDGWGLAYSVGRLQQIPYRELSSLYVFTGNSPCRTSDYLGLLSMQTIDGPSDVVPWWKGGIRRCRGCGDFWWKVRFTTDGSEITGYLIQEVSVVYQVKTCAGAIPSGYPVNMTFYEAYEIKDGGDAEDIWWDAEGPRCCTKGIKTVGAKIAFFWIGTLPSTFVPNNPLCPTDAPCTTTRPWFFGLTRPWISNYINRTMTKWWKCCPTQYCGITASPLQAP